MKYGDLVTFQPIESIIQLRDAGKATTAREHVQSYVISNEMAQRLRDVVIPHLQFESPHDNKGVLIVGNYGTGKSHLLSVLSSVAENAEMLEYLRDDSVREAAGKIAGKFKTIRLEIGSTEMGLREILTSAIETHLEKWGVSYRFPEADKQAENKSLFDEMMTAFHAEFPDHGLLLVVDELLDYLRGRKEQPLILDLGFLREIGEVCRDLRFRFVAGIQEAIFETGNFGFVANSLRRVKDRFVQAKIASADVQYVVANRLLKKTSEQRSQVQDYLQPFTPYYSNMNERLDEFVELFPIHPEYIEAFEDIPIVEKRGVLKVICDTIATLVDEEVPSDHPGIVSYDSYWKVLLEEPAHLSEPEVKEVADCAEVISAKIRYAFPRKQYKAMAARIVNGLAVHRLTTHDVYAPVGLTPEELRDGLCLYNETVPSLPGDGAINLLTVVEKVLTDIRKSVDGSFISVNADNRQHFLDLKKQEDYDAIIERHTEKLTEDTLDSYYYDALRQVMECTDVPTHVSGYQIWQQELIWRERNAPRLGYLFFGTPNERSTAIPKRDFYLYFIQPLDAVRFDDNKRPDEVFFRLSGADEAFHQALQLYAAGMELASKASGGKREIYRRKAMDHLNTLTRWLRNHVSTAYEVTYQGQKKKLQNWLKGTPGGNQDSVRDTVNAVAATCLSSHFANIAPAYPYFSVLLTSKSIPQAAQDAIRGISQPATRTKQGTAVLDALELLDGDRLEPANSQYASSIIDMLKAKGQGQVLNRQELIRSIEGVDYFLPDQFRLEPEWAAVLLASLVYSGDIVLVVPGEKFDATKLPTLATTPVAELVRFKHVERPKDWNIPALKALFELMGLVPGLAIEVTQGKTEPVQQLHKTIHETVDKLVHAQQQLLNGIPFWGQNLFSEGEARQLSSVIDEAKDFLEGLQAYNSPGKLKNLKHDRDDILAHQDALAKLGEIEKLQAFAGEISEYTHYLSMAESYLPDNHEWTQRSRELRKCLVEDVRDPAKRDDATFKTSLLKQLRDLKNQYVQTYVALHRKARLNHDQDKAKSELVKDERLTQLQKLTHVNLVNRQQLVSFREQLGKLKACFALTEKDLEHEPKCPHCNYWPSMESGNVPAGSLLETMEAELESMTKNWTQTLLDGLNDPTAQENLKLLAPDQQKTVERFVEQGELPDEVTTEFVQALQDVLSGLTKVAVKTDQLRAALFPNGNPAKPEEFRERFEQFLNEALKGRDPSKVRLVME